MANISLIAAVDEQFGIGKNNQLLCHLPADLKHFKQLTVGKPVLMGRKTFISIGRALPNRRNIVLSNTLGHIAGVDIVPSLVEGIALAGNCEEIMIIGGADIFRQALTFANRIYLTMIHHQFSADVFFPKIDIKKWHCIQSETRINDNTNRFDMTFCYYQHL
jgi:dihydrofolate reductase